MDRIFKNDAKFIVDMLFDSGVFVDNMTRDDMKATEDYISESMTLRFNSVLKGNDLARKIKEKK